LFLGVRQSKLHLASEGITVKLSIERVESLDELNGGAVAHVEADLVQRRLDGWMEMSTAIQDHLPDLRDKHFYQRRRDNFLADEKDFLPRTLSARVLR
jgi:hypothetical protein